MHLSVLSCREGAERRASIRGAFDLFCHPSLRHLTVKSKKSKYLKRINHPNCSLFPAGSSIKYLARIPERMARMSLCFSVFIVFTCIKQACFAVKRYVLSSS